MTPPTKAIAGLLLKDYAHIMSEVHQEACYASSEVDACLRRVTLVALGETITVDDQLTLTTHYAGHVLGAVMVSATCRGQRVVYTGDFNTTADRHLASARIPRLNPHLLITDHKVQS